jgi:hypothetical protein
VNEHSEELKQFFRDSAARRRENAIKNEKWTFFANANSVGTLVDLWEEWVELLGKDNAVKFFVHCMIKWTEALREAKRQQDIERGKR